MPSRLHRYYGAGYLHFITTSCYQRRALLGKKQDRDLFLEVLEQVRRRYRFAVIGYVVMPEHLHLLLSEPERRNPSVLMQALKQGFARRLLGKMRRAGWLTLEILIFLNIITTDGCPTRRGVRRVGTRALAPMFIQHIQSLRFNGKHSRCPDAASLLRRWISAWCPKFAPFCGANRAVTDTAWSLSI